MQICPQSVHVFLLHNVLSGKLYYLIGLSMINYLYVIRDNRLLYFLKPYLPSKLLC